VTNVVATELFKASMGDVTNVVGVSCFHRYVIEHLSYVA